MLSHCLLQQHKNMKPTFSMLIHCLAGHLNTTLVQACPQALGTRNTNVTLTTSKQRDDTDSSKYSHGCHTINIYIQWRLFSWDEECKLVRKTREEIPSLISCYLDFHMQLLREWKSEDIYMFWPTGNIPKGCITFRNVVCKPGNHLLLAHSAAELERGRVALIIRD